MHLVIDDQSSKININKDKKLVEMAETAQGV